MGQTTDGRMTDRRWQPSHIWPLGWANNNNNNECGSVTMTYKKWYVVDESKAR